MEYDQNTNEFKNKDMKSDNNSKDLSVNIISSKSAMELTKDLNMRRGIKILTKIIIIINNYKDKKKTKHFLFIP